MSASFEEKSVWITLLSLLAVFGYYFFVAFRMLSEGIRTFPPFVALFTGVTVLLVVILVASHTVAAIASRPDGRDERDRVISWRAEHGSSWILAAGVLTAITTLAIPEVERVVVAHTLLLALFISELVKHSLQLVYYRRGM